MKTFLSNLIFVLLAWSSFSQSEKVEIYSADKYLNAYFYAAEGDTKKPTLIWCHGNPGRKEEGKSKFAQELNKQNINVIRFNYRGLWGTEGIYSLGNSIEDLFSVLDFIYQAENIKKYHIDTANIIVGGYSFGSNVAMLSGLKDNRIKNIFCLGIVDHNHLYFSAQCLDPNNKKLWRELHPYVNEVIWGPGRKYDEVYDEFNQDVLKNTYEYDFVRRAEKLVHKHIFIIVGLNDKTVPIEYHFLPIHRKFVEMGHKKYKYRIVEDDHSFLNLKMDARARMISQWIAAI